MQSERNCHGYYSDNYRSLLLFVESAQQRSIRGQAKLQAEISTIIMRRVLVCSFSARERPETGVWCLCCLVVAVELLRLI